MLAEGAAFRTKSGAHPETFFCENKNVAIFTQELKLELELLIQKSN
jgi:hypothetical protein